VSDNSSLDKVLDRLPYADGTGRRRFVAGGILLIGIIIIFADKFGTLFKIADIELSTLLGSPIILLAAVLILYALGNLAEMIAGLFLVRMASGVMWTLGFPRRVSRRLSGTYMRWLAFGGLIAWSPFYMLWEMIRGLRGDTRFRLPLESELTPEALKLLDALPPKVRSGLYHPVSDDADYSTKYMIDTFATEYDRRWARRLLGQADDVSSVTTAFFIIVLLISTNSVVVRSGQPEKGPELTPDEQTAFYNVTARYIEESNEFIKKAGLGELFRNKPLAKCLDKYLALRPSGPERSQANATLLDLDEPRENLECRRLVLNAALPDQSYTSGGLNVKTQVDTLRMKMLKESNAFHDELADIYDETKQRLFAQQVRSTARAVVTIAAIVVVFLFLYIGYFKTLRNAFINIIEAAALRSGSILREGNSNIVKNTIEP